MRELTDTYTHAHPWQSLFKWYWIKGACAPMSVGYWADEIYVVELAMYMLLSTNIFSGRLIYVQAMHGVLRNLCILCSRSYATNITLCNYQWIMFPGLLGFLLLFKSCIVSFSWWTLFLFPHYAFLHSFSQAFPSFPPGSYGQSLKIYERSLFSRIQAAWTSEACFA